MDIFESWLVNTPICKYGITSVENPENSFGAYSEAIKNNYPILICVQSLDDENIICFAYKNIADKTSGKGYVQTLALKDIENLKIGKSNFNIITLNKALDCINGKVPVLINILNENNNGKMENALYNIINNYKGEIAIMSANPNSVLWFKNNAPEILRGVKSGKFDLKTYGSYKTRKLKKLKFCKICEPDFIVYNACDLPNRFVKKYNYLPIIAYNVKNEQEYLKAVKFCDNVIFDGFTPQI